MAELFRQANTVMAMRPTEFWDLTPFECSAMIEGAAGRESRAWERTACLASLLINVSGKTVKKPVTPEQLLGRRPKVVPRDPGAELEALKARALELASKQGA